MAEQLIVPKLGMAAAVVTLTAWKAKDGDRVETGDPVLDIEAEKSTFEMEAPKSGYLVILLEEGVETDVNTVVGLIAETEAEYAALRGGGESVSEPVLIEKAAPAEVQPASSSRGGGERIFISPLARRIAAENGLDIAALAGSGPQGRIQRKDVEAALAARKPAPANVPAAGSARPAFAPPSAADAAGKQLKEVIPYRGMRKAIGQNMMRSLAINAPNTMSGDFDLTIMAKYRENFVQQEGRLGTRITIAEMVMYAVAKALKQFPLMNSSLIDDEIRLWDSVNIGMAVALGEHGEKGLVVPVIRDADRMSLVDLSKAAKLLAEKARTDRLAPEERSGGTFTVSNFGSMGVSSYSTPIINLPESGIIALGRLQKKPIVRNDGIVIAPMLPYSLTHDHRVTDGAAAERFLAIVKGHVENRSAELSEMILF